MSWLHHANLGKQFYEPTDPFAESRSWSLARLELHASRVERSVTDWLLVPFCLSQVFNLPFEISDL